MTPLRRCRRVHRPGRHVVRTSECRHSSHRSASCAAASPARPGSSDDCRDRTIAGTRAPALRPARSLAVHRRRHAPARDVSRSARARTRPLAGSPASEWISAPNGPVASEPRREPYALSAESNIPECWRASPSATRRCRCSSCRPLRRVEQPRPRVRSGWPPRQRRTPIRVFGSESRVPVRPFMFVGVGEMQREDGGVGVVTGAQVSYASPAARWRRYRDR